MLLSVLVPVFNEEALVGQLLDRVAGLQLPDDLTIEIIVVDDGSSDRSAEAVREFIARHPGRPFHLIRHQRNHGKGDAVRTAMQAAKGEIWIIQDADLEYDPADIPRVAEPIIRGREQVVYGSRILREKELGRSGVLGLVTGKHPHSYVLAYLGGVAVTKWVNLLTGAALTDEPTCYKCFHRSAMKNIEIENHDFAWEPEVTMKLLTAGIRIAEIPVDYHPRKNEDGKKINWKDGIKALWTVWKFR
ncbi:MAG: glycosyltransferase family 2 protein [Verrucomicrobiota bacterium JB025]|nr:glycosyltransferase family 2 protein [Verrucomicrobiota bacterium JB025]